MATRARTAAKTGQAAAAGEEGAFLDMRQGGAPPTLESLLYAVRRVGEWGLARCRQAALFAAAENLSSRAAARRISEFLAVHEVVRSEKQVARWITLGEWLIDHPDQAVKVKNMEDVEKRIRINTMGGAGAGAAAAAQPVAKGRKKRKRPDDEGDSSPTETDDETSDDDDDEEEEEWQEEETGGDDDSDSDGGQWREFEQVRREMVADLREYQERLAVAHWKAPVDVDLNCVSECGLPGTVTVCLEDGEARTVPLPRLFNPALEQFFTPKATAQWILHRLQQRYEQDSQTGEHVRMYWLDPCVGDGAFFRYLPETRRLGCEVCPLMLALWPEVQALNFLDDALPEDLPADLIVVMNPPWDQAEAFMQRAMEVADVVCAVLPTRFRRHVTQAKMPERWHLVADADLEDQPFRVGRGAEDYKTLNCVLQVWERREGAKRPRHPAFRWLTDGDWGGDWEFCRKADANAKVLIRESAHKIGRAEAVGADAPPPGPDAINERAKVEWLLCTDPAATVARFNARQAGFVSLAPWRASGNNPHLTREDLLTVYVLPTDARFVDGEWRWEDTLQ